MPPGNFPFETLTTGRSSDGSSAISNGQGFIPFDELPSFYNPPQGWIVTANQNPFPEKYAYRVHAISLRHIARRRFAIYLRRAKGWKPEELVAVEKDVYSAFSHFLARQV